jgi:hypothetical protein
MNYCVNCKNYSRNGYVPHLCYAAARGINPVTGQPESAWPGAARAMETDCGPEGRWFEAREPEKPNFVERLLSFFPRRKAVTYSLWTPPRPLPPSTPPADAE